jgi:hypothetical protein
MRNRTELHFIIPEEKEEIFMQCLNGSEPYAVLKFSVVRKWLAGLNLTKLREDFFLNNQPDALIIQIYSVIKLYMFRASFLPIIRSSLLYLGHW